MGKKEITERFKKKIDDAACEFIDTLDELGETGLMHETTEVLLQFVVSGVIDFRLHKKPLSKSELRSYLIPLLDLTIDKLKKE